VDKKPSTKVKPSGNGSVESPRDDGLVRPDYESWEGLKEIPRSLIGRIGDALVRRPIRELAIIVALIGLIILERDLITMTHGSGLPPPQGLICIITLAVMICALALYHHINFVGRNRNHAKDRKRGKKATEPGDERGGAPEARIPARKDRRR
jgi:hypothetical protein